MVMFQLLIVIAIVITRVSFATHAARARR